MRAKPRPHFIFCNNSHSLEMPVQFLDIVLLIQHSVDMALLRLVVGIVAIAGEVVGRAAATEVQ